VLANKCLANARSHNLTISARRPLAELQMVFKELKASTDIMKVLIDTRGE